MIDDIVSKIEKKIKNSPSMKESNKEELLTLLSNLKSEISDLYDNNEDDAQSIANFTEIATHEVARKDRKTHLVELSQKGLVSSVQGLEVSHPGLIKAVNSFAEMLSKIGI